MSWMQTFTGKAFYPTAPAINDIDIEDIAHALGMQCRYNGHCRTFYSVAEHSVLLSHTVDPEHAPWALLHDAAEAYVGDMVRPLKHQMPEFEEAEDKIMSLIAAKFGLGGDMPAQVKEQDTQIVVDEREQLMAPSQRPWSLLEGFPPLGVTIHGWSPRRAKAEYLSRYQQLFNDN